MFGFFESDNSDWFPDSNDNYGFGSVDHSRSNCSYGISDYESKRWRNEGITRDYFCGKYGADRLDIGFQVPDWDWK